MQKHKSFVEFHLAAQVKIVILLRFVVQVALFFGRCRQLTPDGAVGLDFPEGGNLGTPAGQVLAIEKQNPAGLVGRYAFKSNQASAWAGSQFRWTVGAGPERDAHF